jgi:hypothetical protein
MAPIFVECRKLIENGSTAKEEVCIKQIGRRDNLSIRNRVPTTYPTLPKVALLSDLLQHSGQLHLAQS